ncbi:MAG: hypothetical protein PEPC_01669 [Peptostreptococcus russellii]
MDKRNYREVIGERLKAFREERGLTAYKVAQAGGIRIDQVKAIELGETNYTIDAFLGYIAGSDLYIFFGEKTDGRKIPHDFNDMAKKAAENVPEK